MTDFGIAAQIKPQESDALGTIGKLQAAQTGMLKNRLLGLEFGGKQALGEIIGQNTDPETGETNWQGVSAAASQRPDAAILMPEIQKQVLDRKIAEMQLSGVTLDTQVKRAGIIANTMGSLLSAPEGSLTPTMMREALETRLVKSGLFGDKASVTQLASVYQQVEGMNDGQLRQLAKQYGQAADMAASRIQTQYAQEHGGLTPAEDTTPTTVLAQGPGTTKVPSQITRGQFIKLAGQGPVQTGAPQTAEGVPLANAGEAAYSTTDPQTLQPKVVTRGEAAHAAATGGTPEGIVTGPRAGAVEAATGVARSNAEQAQALQARAAIVPQRQAALKSIADTTADFVPGPNAKLTLKGSQHLVQIADQLGIKVPENVRRGVASQEEANKLFAQVALDQWSALGGSGSNEQLSTAMKANPSETISRLGMQNLTALLQGNEDAIGAQFKAWTLYKGKHGEDSYGDFLAGWNSHYDPRAFQYTHMSPAARKAMVGKMSPADRKAFGEALSFAEQVSNLKAGQ